MSDYMPEEIQEINDLQKNKRGNGRVARTITTIF